MKNIPKLVVVSVERGGVSFGRLSSNDYSHLLREATSIPTDVLLSTGFVGRYELTIRHLAQRP